MRFILDRSPYQWQPATDRTLGDMSPPIPIEDPAAAAYFFAPSFGGSAATGGAFSVAVSAAASAGRTSESSQATLVTGASVESRHSDGGASYGFSVPVTAVLGLGKTAERATLQQILANGTQHTGESKEFGYPTLSAAVNVAAPSSGRSEERGRAHTLAASLVATSGRSLERAASALAIALSSQPQARTGERGLVAALSALASVFTGSTAESRNSSTVAALASQAGGRSEERRLPTVLDATNRLFPSAGRSEERSRPATLTVGLQQSAGATAARAYRVALALFTALYGRATGRSGATKSVTGVSGATQTARGTSGAS